MEAGEGSLYNVLLYGTKSLGFCVRAFKWRKIVAARNASIDEGRP